MKKEYVKPVMMAEEFYPSEAVTACDPTQVKEYEEQTIECIINGTEKIFYTNCANNAQSGKIVNIENPLEGGTCDNNSHQPHSYQTGEYYIWYNRSGGSGNPPCNIQDTAIKAIQNLAEIKNEPGWHAGPVTSEIRQIVNMS